MSRSVPMDYEAIREQQARAQEADRIGHSPEHEIADDYEREERG